MKKVKKLFYVLGLRINEHIYMYFLGIYVQFEQPKGFLT